MQPFKQGKIDLQLLKTYIAKPKLYQKSTKKFWDDEYVSKQMLKLHLDPKVESASRTKATIEAEAAFIIHETGMNGEKVVLDLGCGPGLYVKEFAKTGAYVTGLDISKNTINYAKEHITPEMTKTEFVQMNYLDLDFVDLFDVVTLIYYDFCVLSPDEQKVLLQKIYRSLKEGGSLVFDVISENYSVKESTSVNISDGEGFWKPTAYMEIINTYIYENPKTFGQQYTIISEDGTVETIRLFSRLFSIFELTALLTECGFTIEKVYKNLKGDPLTEKPETYGVFARKSKN